MSRAAREWVRGLDEHLIGPPRALLWAAADRANDAGRFWTSERTIARESGVSYREVRYLLPILVELGVLAKEEKRRGTRPAVYRFTLRDPAGLPSAAPRTALGGGLVRHQEQLVRHPAHASAAHGAAEPDRTKEPPSQGGSFVHPESNDRDRGDSAGKPAAASTPADGERFRLSPEMKAAWRAELAPPPSAEGDSADVLARKRAARERLERQERKEPP